MGQSFQAILNGQKTKQQADKLRDFLDNSQTMLEQKHQIFVNQVLTSGQKQKQLPVSRRLQSNYQIRVSLVKGTDIGEQVTKIASKFSDKKFAEAIGSTISTVTDIVFGRASGAVQEHRGYFVIVGLTGAIMRVDYLIYLKMVNAKGLINLAQNFYLCSYMISSVDTKDLSFNDYASAVQLCYASIPVKDRKKLIKVIQNQGVEQEQDSSSNSKSKSRQRSNSRQRQRYRQRLSSRSKQTKKQNQKAKYSAKQQQKQKQKSNQNQHQHQDQDQHQQQHQHQNQYQQQNVDQTGKKKKKKKH